MALFTLLDCVHAKRFVYIVFVAKEISRLANIFEKAANSISHSTAIIVFPALVCRLREKMRNSTARSHSKNRYLFRSYLFKICSSTHHIQFTKSFWRSLFKWKYCTWNFLSKMVSKELIKIERNEKVGRFAVAADNTKAGTVLLEEEPLVVGPKPNTVAVCLECCSPIDGTDKGPRCQHCNWPLCEDCRVNSTRKFHGKECELFVQHKVRFQSLKSVAQICLQMDCITPLRYCRRKQRIYF